MRRPSNRIEGVVGGKRRLTSPFAADAWTLVDRHAFFPCGCSATWVLTVDLKPREGFSDLAWFPSGGAHSKKCVANAWPSP